MAQMEGKEKKAMTKKSKSEYSWDEFVSVFLSLILVIILVGGLADVGMMNYWWGFFIVCNVGYILHGMKKGWAEGDPANGLVVLTGPIAFYFWTILIAWRTYGWKAKKHE